MKEAQLLKRLQLYRSNPEIVRPLEPSELAELLLIVLDYIKTTDKNVSQGKLRGPKGEDGRTPQPDRDYISLSTARKEIREMFAKAVQQIKDGKDGKDGRDGRDAVVTDAQIEAAAERAYQMIQLPDFDTLLTQEPQAIRNALELLQDDDRLDAKAIKGLEERLQEARTIAERATVAAAGGTNKNWVNERVSRIRLEELANVYVSATEPSNPQVGDFWFDLS